jgi:hypothetical protein
LHPSAAHMYQVFKENPFLFKKNNIISNMAAYSIFQGKIVSLIPLAKIPERIHHWP